MTALLDAALSYARRRWYVFPLDGKGDHLTGKGGHRNATTDEHIIRAWWRQWPDANIGVWLRRSGLIAIDYDGEDGKRTLAKLEAKYGPLPRTLHQQSPSGGGHIFMLDPSGDPESSAPVRGNFGKGSKVDIKCNGYVLLEPSRANGARYKFASTDDAERVPKTWIPHLQPKENGAGGDVAAWEKTVDTGRRVEDLREALDEIGPSGEGGTMFRAICTIFEDFGLSIDDGWPYLKAWNARRHEPLTEGQLKRQVEKVGEKKAGTGARWKVDLKGFKKGGAGKRAPKSHDRWEGYEDGMIRGDRVKPQKVEWLWTRRIPFGFLSLVEGAGGCGKSGVLLDVAARLTTGRVMFDDTTAHPPANVLVLTEEPDFIVRMRFAALGGDLKRLYIWRFIETDDNGEIALTIDQVEELERRIREHGVRFVYIDPLADYMPSRTDSHNDQSVRLVLRPVEDVAARTGAAITALRHFNKRGGAGASNRGSGSPAFRNIARTALQVYTDREDEEIRYLAQDKTNIGRHAPTLRFRMVSTDPDGPNPDDVPGVPEWIDVADGVTADDLDAAPPPERDLTTTDQCVEFLREMLADGPMSHDAVSIAADARSLNMKGKPMRVARERLVDTVKKGKPPHQVTYWRLKGGES